LADERVDALPTLWEQQHGVPATVAQREWRIGQRSQVSGLRQADQASWPTEGL